MESLPDTATIWLRRTFALLVAVFLLLGLTAWEVHSIKQAVEALEIEVPKQSTEVPIQVNGVNTTTAVTTTFQEAPHQSETDAEWDARHIATCLRIKAAWAGMETP